MCSSDAPTRILVLIPDSRLENLCGEEVEDATFDEANQNADTKVNTKDVSERRGYTHLRPNHEHKY